MSIICIAAGFQMSDFKLNITYSDKGLNSVEGIAGITSKKKVNVFLHEKVYYLCRFIYWAMWNASKKTRSDVESIAEELAKKNRLLIHQKAFLRAKKIWKGQKKSHNEKMPEISESAKARYGGKKTATGTAGVGVKRTKGVKIQTFKVFRRDDGNIFRYTRYKGKRKQGVEYAEMTLDSLKAWQEAQFRKAASGNTARMFKQMAEEASKTKNSYRASGSFDTNTNKDTESSNSVTYKFGYTDFKADFKSHAFGKKHFTKEVYNINWWLQPSSVEGRDMYHGSLNEKAIKAGLENTYNDVYKHIKEKGVNIE